MSQEQPQDKQMDLTGPGRRLMEARCALNLSREDVARQLRLKREIISAIEEDRIDELPAPIYVLGYLRNYSELLKLPHEPVVDAYQQLHVEAPPIINDVVKPKSRKASQRITRWGSIIIGVVLLAGFISWLQTQDFDFLSGQSNGDVDVAEAPLQQQKVETTTVEEPAADENTEIVQDSSLESLPAEAPVASPVEAVSQPETTAPVDVAVEVGVTPAGDKLVISLKDDCWVEIKSVNGDIVIYDLLREGKTHTFYGIAPFTVFLGNAAAVELSVNDKPYDINPHIRGTLARFTLQVANSNE